MKTTDFHKQLMNGFQFEKVLELDFTSHQNDDQPNKFFVFWNHRDSLLLCHDTFHCGWALNVGKCYFNWIPNNLSEHPSGCSGGFHNGIWVGEFDCRYMDRLKFLYDTGSFVSPWKVRPWLYLAHHGDKLHHSDNAEVLRLINGERLLLLPEHVQWSMAEEEIVNR
jgi:hypothetical protein